ncbi:MAG TPA: hypothetical protein VLT16_13635, partial [Candidatus Limnocylindrales bacterium]|nr:hypothetical protein [Candidatus Limnocylindrales bacterium]
MAVQEDLLEKGFQLAYFIFPSRSTAFLILSSALNKLHAQRGREARRSYWRDKHLKRGITRITREEGDALQWLIFYESDKYEKQQESDDDPSLRDMVVRYIKNLVRMTTAMSSFYVNIGLHRLLHNYTTAETQRIYEAITDRYLGSDEYRRAKGLLMGKLEKRFGRLLRTLRTQHGELRFEVMQDQAPWAVLVDTCLKAFTPWSTATNCPVPRDFDATQGKLPPHLSGVGTDKLDPNEIEINRCHAFIDPVCYGRLAEALTFEAPSRKLAVPRFYMDNVRNDGPSIQPPQQGGLTAEERKTILDEISNQDSRRQKINPQFVSLVVDGVEKARLNLDSQRSYGFEIEEGAELLEVIADDAGKELVLAAEPIQYTESKGIAASETSLFTFRRGDLALSISPFPQPAGGPRFAMASVSFTPRGWASRKVTAASGWRLLPRLAIPGLALLLLGWFVG